VRSLQENLEFLAARKLLRNQFKIAIFGLGSVGCYLLDYLANLGDSGIEIAVVGRNRQKLERDLNAIRAATLIRERLQSKTSIFEADFESIESMEKVIRDFQPDFIVNSSRAYSGVKYGSISWNTVRAYGLWAPLSLRYVRNITEALHRAHSHAIVINTSYSDATHAWLLSAGQAYPHLGSGNLNHLVPRLKMAVGSLLNLEPKDWAKIQVSISTSHFHDVSISKEGRTDGVDPLLKMSFEGKELHLNRSEIFARCAIAMPVDQKRNMLNASSTFEIIAKLIEVLRNGGETKFHSPGAQGLIGGYPFIIRVSTLSGQPPLIFCGVDQTDFKLEQMIEANRASIYLDGIEGISKGELTYTDELVAKVRTQLNFDLPKSVNLDASDDLAHRLILEVIQPKLAELHS